MALAMTIHLDPDGFTGQLRTRGMVESFSPGATSRGSKND